MNLLWLLMPAGLRDIVKKGLATVAIVSAAYFFVYNQGSKNALHKVEKASGQAVSIADKGGSGTRNPTARGVRDPYTAD